MVPENEHHDAALVGAAQPPLRWADENMSYRPPETGPSGHENWLLALEHAPTRSEYEVQLYSDAHLTDQIGQGCGPYTFLNAVPGFVSPTFAHALTMRIVEHGVPIRPDLSKTDFSRYHGGGLADEICALCSVLVGVRLKCGSASRYFREGDLRGTPRADTEVPASPLPRRMSGWIVPRATQTHNFRMAVAPLLESYPRLSARQAIALVRAARLYQDALWIVEAEPELAWLLFVSAVEAVATEHQAGTMPEEELLQLAMGDLHRELLESGGFELVSRVAPHLARQLLSTKRFVTFLGKFMPPPLERSGDGRAQVSWEPNDLKKSLTTIYGYRSKALHSGIPFPAPMCARPHKGEFLEERPSALAYGAGDSAWMAADLPMHLHVFEHIARNSIISWWRSVVEGSRADDAGR